MRSAVTLCRVPEAAAGPFVFHDSLETGFEKAAGFDAVELFLPGPGEVPVAEIGRLRAAHGLEIAAVGTGAGLLRHGLTLTDPDAGKRAAALDFVISMVRFGGELGAPAILGSVQGRAGNGVAREQALHWLAEALRACAAEAAKSGVPFFYEVLNRYESNLINRQQEAAAWLDAQGLENVLLLADLFHINIEESDPAAALRAVGPRLGHIHWADSNRQAMGSGHTDSRAVFQALKDAGYAGYLSAEVLPLPDAASAAARTLESIKALNP